MSLKKTILAALTACVALSSIAFAENPEPPAVAAQAAYVMDADNDLHRRLGKRTRPHG